jgi:sortase A
MSTTTGTEAPPTEEPSPRQPLGWRIVNVVGEILITIGIFFLLMVVYELWWTSVEAEQEYERQREQLILSWESEEEAEVAVPVDTPPIPAEAFGLMYIPRLGDDVWATPLIEGVTDEDLTKGIGHFPDSALPGDIGNTSFAGHRATYGEPLANVDQLQVDDRVYVETAGEWHTYRLTNDDIVLPTDVWVVDPVPGAAPGTPPTEPLITLVTCDPRWGSTHRWIWWGELVETTPKDEGPPEELAALLAEGV